MITKHTRMTALALALGVVASACGADAADDALDVPESIASSEAEDSQPSAVDSNDEATTDATETSQVSTTDTSTPTTAVTTTAAAKGSTTTANAGSPYDIGPALGEPMDVVGVAYDDVLNFRSAPDPGSAIVNTAAPLSSSPAIVSQGDGWLLPSSAWWRVTVDGTEAWANATYLGMLGQSTDITNDLASSMPSVGAPDLETLAENIGAARSGGPVPLVVFSTEPIAADAQGGEVTIDVIGLGDDSVKGERILVTFQFVFDDINAASPTVVEVNMISATAQAICGRGMAASGACL